MSPFRILSFVIVGFKKKVWSQFEILNYGIICVFLVLSEFEFLSFVTILFVEFCHKLSFWVLSQVGFFSFVTIGVFSFCHKLSFRDLSPFKSLRFVTNSSFSVLFFAIWDFEFCHNLSFWVWSQFEFCYNLYKRAISPLNLRRVKHFWLRLFET